MEPLRPLVDVEVYDICLEGPMLEKASRTRLLGVLAATVETNGRNLAMMAALQTYTASLRRVYAGEAASLQIPVYARTKQAEPEKVMTTYDIRGIARCGS